MMATRYGFGLLVEMPAYDGYRSFEEIYYFKLRWLEVKTSRNSELSSYFGNHFGTFRKMKMEA